LRLEMEKEMTTEEKTEQRKVEASVMTREFFFDRWKQETIDGLRLMESERDTLQAEAQRIAERIATLNRDIEALQAVTSMFENGEDDGKRDSFVKVTLAGVAKDRIKDWVNLEGITEILRWEKPGVKESSVRSAIARLVRDGVLLQDPPVGDIPKGSRVERRWMFNPAYKEPQPPAAPPADPPPKATKQQIAEGISKLLSHKPGGITGKDLAWLATDLGVEVEEISEVINTKMAEGTMETAMENGVDILRAKAPPGSKEDLKRTKIVDRPLFPDMERPEHA